MKFICNKRIYDLEKNTIWTSYGAAIVDIFEFEKTKSGHEKITLNWKLLNDTTDVVVAKNTTTIFKDKIPLDINIIPVVSGEIDILIKLTSDRNIEKVVFLFNKCDKHTLENIESFIINNI